MSSGAADKPLYSITARDYTARYNDRRKSVESGVEFTVVWNPTGQEIDVFVEGDPPDPQAVDEAIRAAGAVDDAYDALGK